VCFVVRSARLISFPAFFDGLSGSIAGGSFGSSYQDAIHQRYGDSHKRKNVNRPGRVKDE
jgi:hypothetical protein